MKSIALITTNSRESVKKARNLGDSAIRLGIHPIYLFNSEYQGDMGQGEVFSYDVMRPEMVSHILVDTKHEILAVIPCSDGCTKAALSAARYFNLIDWFDDGAFTTKASSYALLHRAGIATLNYQELQQFEDIVRSYVTGAVFVKPNWSSGVYSPDPWGYKSFASRHHFAKYLDENGWVDQFNQKSKNTQTASMMMDFIPHDGVYCFSVILREDKAIIFGKSFMKISGSDYFYDYVHYDDAYIPKEFDAYVQNLWKQGYRSPFMYLQCLKVGDQIYPMDMNTRMSTYLNTLVEQVDPSFYDRALEFLLGMRDDFTLNLPDKHVLIGRVRTDPFKPIKNLKWDKIDGVTQLNFMSLGEPVAAYDKAHSWPTFMCLGYTKEEVLTLREQFMKSVKVEQ